MTSTPTLQARWQSLRDLASSAIVQERALEPWLTESILEQKALGSALAFRLSRTLTVDAVQRGRKGPIPEFRRHLGKA